MGGTLDVTQGLARDFLRQIVDGSGNVYDPSLNPSPFLTSDTITAKVWPGEDLTVTVTPSISWVDVTTGKVKVSFSAAQTAALNGGNYLYEAFIQRGTADPGRLDSGRVRVSVSSGSGTQSLAFTTRLDLLRYAPWLEDLQAESETLGFGGEQARATNRLIDAIVASWSARTSYPSIGQPGFSLSGYPGSQPTYWMRQRLIPLVPNSDSPDDLNRPFVIANLIRPAVSTALLLYDEVVEVCARWAIGYICDAQIGRESERDWWALSKRFQRQASSLYKATSFQIDLANPQTGYANYTVMGGATRIR